MLLKGIKTERYLLFDSEIWGGKVSEITVSDSIILYDSDERKRVLALKVINNFSKS
jgi:hypothetical protein